MTGKGRISVLPNQRLRLMLAAQLLWLATICLLGAWWGRLLMRQASRIAELEGQTGISLRTAHEHWQRTQRMLFWESATFFGFLMAATALLFSLYWREARRARGVQAFFASLTHELRTPLTSIRLQAESIADASDSEHREKLVGRLLEDTSRLESQVERTLELARVEGGGSVLSQSFLLKPWLDYFLRTWDEGRGLKLRVNSNVTESQIQADPGAVQIILKNLLENTMRHSGQEKVMSVNLTTEERDGWVVLRYSDDGLGFKGDARKLGQLFEKGPESQGAGVGLYLVSALMQRMGGRAEFATSPKLETSLWFRQGGAANG
ncbi:MAG: HAMP domain-containing histidine kinase [Deltaproteobacteria bacterium]|nr:HAMP domain-containing histidine kinase [Deltaproteobacteria bacterium]